MRQFKYFFLIFLALFDLTLCKRHKKSDSKLAYGFPVEETQNFYVGLLSSEYAEPSKCWFPYLGGRKRLVCDVDQFCNGAVVRTNWVVTSAHCIENMKISEIVVAHGAPELWQMNQYEVDYGVVHTEYTKWDTLAPDIALLKTKQKILVDWTELPVINFERIPSRTFGYLYTTGPDEHGIITGKIKKAEVITQNTECERYPAYFNKTSKMFCYDLRFGGAKKGDSGAPVIATNEDETIENPYVLMAIHSGNFILRPGFKKRMPQGVNVAYFYDWIKHTIYWMDPIPVPENRIYFCCEQKTLEEYLIQPYKLRQFAHVRHLGEPDEPYDWR